MKTTLLNTLTAFLFTACFVGLLGTASAQVNSPKQDLSAYSWSTTATNPVSNQDWDKSAVAAFLDRVLKNDSLPSRVGDFVFADLDADGQLELMATVDYSGRAFFNTILIVNRGSGSFSTQALEVWNMPSLKNKIRDLDADGRMELILTKQLTPYLGARPLASWDSVYTLANSEYIDRSADFSLFYQHEVIPQLKQTTAVPGGIRGKDDDDVLQIELAKINRVLKVDPKAGLELALAWSKEPKSIRRIFAASMLGDIDDASASDALEKLTLDSNVEVAITARSVIARKKKDKK